MVRFVPLLALFIACRPTGPVPLPGADVHSSAARVEFAATYVGFQRTETVVFTNSGGETAEVTVNVAPPFFAEPSAFSLSRGADQPVTFTFAPTSAGSATAETNGVTLLGEGLAVPECNEATACTTSRFDGEQCVDENRADGTGCETNCITGQCNAGTCSGSLKGCATNDACLLPTCDETTGCGSTPRVCPEPTSPCQVARCDSVSGCGFADALDGTLCGDDDCFATQVNVCITGQCVLRPRPVAAQCSNRWVPNTFPSRGWFASAYDAARRRVVVFGGQSFDDTWTHDGTKWEQRLPVSAPPTRAQHAMTWDPVRKRVLLFGGRILGGTLLDETWEWDGFTWLRRLPASSPPPSTATRALAWDSLRRRAVLFLGAQGTWEWDGNTWVQRATTGPAVERSTIAWDGTAQRVVLFGGTNTSGEHFNDVWEWNGSQWNQRLPNTVAPSPRASASLTWDSARRRLVLFGGVSGVVHGDTWEWDGMNWVQRAPMNSPPFLAAGEFVFDEARQRAVLLSGQDDGSWEWDGTDWSRVESRRPPLRADTALATDTVRKRVVLFGGRDLSASTEHGDTWEWDGLSWSQRTPMTPPSPRFGHALSFDALRARMVLFGGLRGEPPAALDETWEWDGTAWLQRTSAVSPPAQSAPLMTWDAARQRTVMTGTGAPVWTWDGATWAEQMPMNVPTSQLAGIAWDDVQQRVLLQNASTWSWDGTDWAQHASTVPWRSEFAMGTDVARRRVIWVVRAPQFGAPLETWEWNGATWTQLQPTASLPSAVHLLLTWDPVRERVMAMVDGTVWHFLP
ncbi:MAG: hypothetical protein ACO1OB_16675 [Archangium sp.]